MDKRKAKTPVPRRLIDIGDAFPQQVVAVAGVLVPAVHFSKAAGRLRRGGDYVAYVREQANFCTKLASGILNKKVTAEPGDHKDAEDMLLAVACLRADLKRGNVGAAALDGIGVGRLAERLRFRIGGYNQHVAKSRRTERTGRKANQERHRQSVERCAAIDAEVQAGIERRGKRKQPSNYALLKKACKNAELKDVASYYRIKRNLKK